MAQPARRADEERQSFSGRLLLRMPPALHAEVSRKAELERTSINQFITAAVAAAVRSNGAESEEDGPAARPSRRALGIALVANLVIVAVTGLVALTLLIVAWRDGF